MAKDLRDLLSKPQEFKVPVPLPVGTYYGQITAKIFGTTKTENETPYVRFTVKLTHADESIPAENLEGVDVSGKYRSKDFFLSEAAGYRLYQLAAALEVQTKDRPLCDIVEDLIGHDVLVKIKHRAGRTADDPVYDEIDSLGAPTT